MKLTEAVRGTSMRSQSSPWPFAFGQIASYDPATHLVVATYEVTDADGNGQTITTPPSQLMVPWWGQGYGDQSGPEAGTQCVIAIVDPRGDEFLVLGFTANNSDRGFGAPAGEKWTVDKRGSSIKFTADGATPGDGHGGLKSIAAAYHSTSTAGGHSRTMDDVAKTMVDQSAGGHAIIWDDRGKALSVVPLATGHVGLGDIAGNLDATRQAAVIDDVKTALTNFISASLQQLSAAIGVAGAATLTGGGAFSAIIGAGSFVTGHVSLPTLPTGSSKVRIAP